MKSIALGLSVAFLLGLAGNACAGLCTKCIDNMHIQDIGVCTKCGGDTSSSAFKVCSNCSEKLHKCQNCMSAMDPTTDKAATPKSDTLELSIANNSNTVTVAKGKDVVIRLAGNPTTGYSWKIGRITGEAVKAQDEPSYEADKHPKGLVGSGGTFVFKLQASQTGTSTVGLVYIRPWEKDTPPVKTFTVTIKVQQK